MVNVESELEQCDSDLDAVCKEYILLECRKLRIESESEAKTDIACSR